MVCHGRMPLRPGALYSRRSAEFCCDLPLPQLPTLHRLSIRTRDGLPQSQAVQVQGDLKTYDDVGNSGKFVHRRFCPNCGSGVIADVDVMPGVTIVLAGSLDEPAVFKPSMEIFCASAQPWLLEPSNQRKKFDQMPG